MAGYQRQVTYFGLIVAPFFLLGCGKNSEVPNQEQVTQQPIDTAASGEAVTSVKQPNAALEELNEVQDSGALEVVKVGCNFEVVANVRPKGAMAQAEDLSGATFAGWVIDAESKKSVSQANLRFADSQSGRVWIAPIAKLAPRLDVAKHFGATGSLNAEFNLVLDLRTLPSATYGLSIDYEGGDGIKRTCSPKANELKI